MDFLRLIRWKNVLMVAVTQLLTWFFIIKPLLPANQELPVSGLELWLFITASICIVAAGYVINDYYDVDIDHRNKPDRTIVGQSISKKYTLYIYSVLVFLGAGFGVITSVFASSLLFGVLFLMAILLLWLYSYRLKRLFLSGNIVVAILAAAPVYSVLMLFFFTDCHNCHLMTWINFHQPLVWFVTGYSFFAVITHFLREIVKDIQDREGDKAHECQTLPVQMGKKSATQIALALSLLILILLIVAQVVLFLEAYYLLFWYSALVVVLHLVAHFKLSKAVTPDDYGKSGSLVKLVMVAGILSMILIPMTI